MGEGITSRHAQRDAADADQLVQLHRKARAAAAKVGVKNVVLHQLPDNRLDTVPLLDVVKIVEDLVERIRPEVIYTHHAGDLNVDHGIIHRAVLTATRPLAGQPVREIYAFEVPSSTEWAFQRIEPHSGRTFLWTSRTRWMRRSRRWNVTNRRRASFRIRGRRRRCERSLLGGEAWSDARRRRRSNWCDPIRPELE